ncbi:MAG: hypothetical protein JO250_00625 [Armatimonadetes bacterium]|nr:hypothetical protein [Armatimonadota bacterium]
MDSTLTLEPSAKEAETAIMEMLAEMKRLDVRIAQNQDDIDRLQAETRAMLNELRISLGMVADVASVH